jgi:hypothetical protein
MTISRFRELHSSISRGLASIGIDMKDLDDLLLWQHMNPEEYMLRLHEEEKTALESERKNQAILDTFMKSLSPEQRKLYIRVEKDLISKCVREMNDEARLSA